MYFKSYLGRWTASCWALPHISSLFLFLIRHRISELRRPIDVKFCHIISICISFIMHVQKFGGRSPKKFGGPKTCKIWHDFTQLPTLIANISATTQDIQNRKVTWSRPIPPTFDETSPVNFGPLSRKFGVWVWTHPNRLFGQTIFRSLGGAGSWNFYTR